MRTDSEMPGRRRSAPVRVCTSKPIPAVGCSGPDSFTFHATASESVAAADARAGLKQHEPFGAGIVDDAFVQAVPKQRELDSIGPDLAAPHGAGISLVRLAVMDLRPLA